MFTITRMAVTAAPVAGRCCSTARQSSTPGPAGRASPSQASPTRSSCEVTRATAWPGPRSSAALAAATSATCSMTALGQPGSATASIRLHSTSRGPPKRSSCLRGRERPVRPRWTAVARVRSAAARAQSLWCSGRRACPCTSSKACRCSPVPLDRSPLLPQCP